jgi:hypothetical protein
VVEKGFVDSLIKQIKKGFHGSVVIRASDNFTLGIPDVIASIPAGGPGHPPLCWMLAIEAKQMRPLMDDPFHKGRRTGLMLKHHFSGPQISMLRKMKEGNWDAFGLVRASCDIAFRIDPKDIPAKTGNFTHEELMEFGKPVHRVKGIWQFWSETYDQVPSSRHRDNP